MLKRVISGVLGVPILLAIIHYGGMALFLSVLVISVIGLSEFYRAVRNKGINPISWVGYLASIGIISLFNFNFEANYILFLIVVTTFILSIILLLKPKYNITDASITAFGIIYVTILLGHVLLTSKQDNSIAIWLIFITAWATDTCAYFTGVFFGKRKLCPVISPKKTIEGAIGGLVGSIVISGIFGYLFLADHLLVVLLIGLIGSILSVFGDLTASIIKRYVEVKDYGNLMPGHGGVLDRFDSILFTAPVVYYFLIFMINNG
ncbi:phosphatidate cytidylyltransferase [Alkaliphilus hydrothermalis]|uniref:Phosphatidate cytidylyltransferase n=1 Tax=Alkaliphilus hydrothermalis TaxID=1482730 RepID=A0ABS2NL87_9FIRM|nr:phosphatidate cytidylyltransferase [Alkaliphilus hydrothermalis]MBM7613696.1 phosphatidate cytidylyltransferase [Alkaliphilus hydrothermalis]